MSGPKVFGLAFGLLFGATTFMMLKAPNGSTYPVLNVAVSILLGAIGGLIAEGEFAKKGWKSLRGCAAYWIALIVFTYGIPKAASAVSMSTLSAAIGVIGVIVAVIGSRFFHNPHAFQSDRLIDWPKKPRTTEEEYKSENTGCSLLFVGVILAILGALGWIIF
ncbi:MAG: hypothetical protein Q8N84_02455 [bacterium]|nr:hypothetical protein [bacterium]